MDYITIEAVNETYAHYKTEPQQLLNKIREIYQTSTIDWNVHYILSCLDGICKSRHVQDWLIIQSMEKFKSRIHLFTSVN